MVYWGKSQKEEFQGNNFSLFVLSGVLLTICKIVLSMKRLPEFHR